MDIHEAFAWYDRAIDNAIDYLNLDREEQDKAWNVIDKFIDEAIARQSATSEDAFPSAIKWTGKNLREVINLTGWNESASSKWTWAEYEQVVEEKGLKIFTPNGSVMAGIGDWIIYDGKDCYVTTQKKKSATSEEVQRAIEVIKDIQQEYIKQDHTRDDVLRYESLSLAITAMQAYQPTTRKNRTVEEAAIPKTETTSCEWCINADYIEVVAKVHRKGSWGFQAYEAKKAKHCPNCGRKLKENE